MKIEHPNDQYAPWAQKIQRRSASNPPLPRVWAEASTLGDCPLCDGYCLYEADKPLCPTCARLTREGTQP